MKASARARSPRSIVTIAPKPPRSRLDGAVVVGVVRRGRGSGRRPDRRVPPRAARRGPAPSRRHGPTGAASVARPRVASQHSNGLPVRPKAEATRAARPIASRGPATSPSVRSLWPPISFVPEWTTNVAPSSIGRQSRGAKVWSTTSAAPASRAIAASRGRSGRRSERVRERLDEDQPGPVGQGRGERLGPGGVEAGGARRRSGRARGRSGRSSCRRAARRRRRGRPPRASASRTAAVAAIPEAQTSAASAPSSAATLLGELRGVRVAVAGVDEAVGLAGVDGVDVVEALEAVDDAQLRRRDERRGRRPGRGGGAGAERRGVGGRHRRSGLGCGSRGGRSGRSDQWVRDRPVLLAVDPAGDAEADDRLAELPGGAAGGRRRRGPPRPARRDSVRAAQSIGQACSTASGLAVADVLGQAVEQRVVDRAGGRPVEVLLDRLGARPCAGRR